MMDKKQVDGHGVSPVVAAVAGVVVGAGAVVGAMALKSDKNQAKIKQAVSGVKEEIHNKKAELKEKLAESKEQTKTVVN